ncbi:helix-turn-helix domain-containing protein [Pseudomonas sp. GOM7]|uniref:helix-turn-helix domain-containing protein n=1 Tax=Pseudomonas sp. GOM7 TaxID=2998079 RepID=UPI00227B86A8|nr:helix-turn-helix domain-containing protein [Pseudomonas sp. GOM7]WAJ35922.1 helix-turn-helix domain-containing protein [Pseudomonas sp. GOM7]
MYDVFASSTASRRNGNSPFSRRVSSQDIDEHAEQVSDWQLTYDQMTAGRFHGELTEFSLDWMQVIRDRTNQSLIKRGSAKPGTINFSIPLSFSGDFYCDGHLVSEGNALVAHADDLPQLRTPDEMDLVMITVDQNILEQELVLQGIAFESTHLPKTYQLKGLTLPQNLRNILADLEYGSAHAQFDLSDECIRRQFRDAIMLQLFELLPSSQPIGITPSARKRTVDRACEYALAHLDEPLSILDMCHTLGASRRKLQYCFQETLGTNPVAYLRALRLNAARRELRQGAAQVSVQEVASRWGFWHLSRFSSEYRAMFGERPSQTLHR